MTILDTTRRMSSAATEPVFACVLIGGAAVLLMLPSILLGVPKGHDFAYHRIWLSAFTERQGLADPYPRWLEDLWFGAGGADMFFYPPLPYFLGGAIQALGCGGCGVDTLLIAIGLVALAISGIGFWTLARRFARPSPALAAAVLYMGLPYHLGTDWYDRLALAELTAIAVLPWHLAAFIDCLAGRRGGSLAGPRLALLSGLLALGHLPTAMIVAVGYAPLVFVIERPVRWPRVGACALAGAVGLGIGAIYWVPAVDLLHSVRGDLLGGAALTRLHFLAPANLGESWFMDSLWEIFAALSAISLIALLAVRGADPRPRAIAGVLILLTWFMVTPLSSLLWFHTPVGRIQFPWRFLALFDLAVALAALVALDAALDARMAGRRRFLAAIAFCAIALVAGLRHPGPSEYRARVTVPDWPPKVVGAAEWLPAETLETASLQTYRDYERLREEAGAWTGGPVRLAEGHGRVRVTETAPRRIVFEADLPAPARLLVHRTFWRYWRLENTATGGEAPLEPTPGFPFVSTELPAGRGLYVLELPVLAAERRGAIATALSLLFLTIWYGMSRRRSGPWAGRSRAGACE